MKVDLTHYSERLSKTLAYIRTLEMPSKEGDGFVLLNLSDLSPFIVLTTKLIIKLKDQELDESLVKEFMKSYLEPKTTLTNLFSKRIKKINEIKDEVETIAELLKKLHDHSDRNDLSAKIIKAIDEKLNIKMIKSIETEADQALCQNLREFLDRVKDQSDLSYFGEEISHFRDKMFDFSFRYFSHYEELAETSKLLPQLFDDNDISFGSIMADLTKDLKASGVEFDTQDSEEQS